MLGVNVTYTMKPGKREEFSKQLAASGAHDGIRREPGCIQFDYFCSVDQPDILFLLEKWTDRDAQKVHLTQPHMDTVRTLKDQFILDTVIELYDL